MNVKTGNITRRNFIKLSGISGTALVLGLYIPVAGKKAIIVKPAAGSPEAMELNAWISIDTSGTVTLTDHRAEMGQGSYQAVPQILAEELEVDLNNVTIVFAPGDGKKYGRQVTGGSSTVRSSWEKLSKLGATAREMLIKAAAKKWKVLPAECYAEKGFVMHKPSGKKYGYGDLVEEAVKLDPPENVKLKSKKDYKLLRRPLPRQDTPLKTNGTAVFGIDVNMPGMMYAVVERSPRFVGKIKSFDASGAKSIPGVKHVFKIQADVFAHKQEGIAVVADNIWAAMQGRKKLTIEWDDSGFEHLDTGKLYDRMNSDLKKDPLLFKTKGDFSSAFDNSVQKVEAVYETPYESHSCMEPLNCFAHVHDGKCEMWAPTQMPDMIRQDISKLLGFSRDNVTVHMTFLGGGFGRKAFLDFPQEAALISKEIKAPVKVIWTREDDMRQGPFRPGAVYECKAALNNGRIEAFRTIMAAQNMGHQYAGADKTKANDSTVEGLLEPYYDSIKHYSFGDVPTKSPIPVMWWRSVYSSTNGFAYESFMDELAHAAGKDPLDFRREHLDNPRYQALIDRLEAVSGWKNRNKNDGWGVAITECFGSVVGEVAKISRNASGGIKLDKAYAVVDCGWYVNPDIIGAQVEGSMIMALGAAAIHATHFKDGKAVEQNFDHYPMPRISDSFDVEVHVMDNDEKPGGVGEPGLPPFGPALCNAIFDLTGKRIRKLPFNMKTV